MLLRRFLSVSRKIHRLIQESLNGTGIGSGQVFILLSVLENQGVNQEYICQELAIDKSTVTKGIKYLLKEKYILRIRDKNDKRNWILFPTKKSENIADDLKNAVENVNSQLIDNFTESDEKYYIQLLDKIEKNIQQ